MKKIMIRADDLGYSKAVNYGIYETVKNGLIKNIGLMVNMPESVSGYELVKNYDICLGQHTNVCVGKPLCDPSLIPSLLLDNGQFKPSSMYRSSKKDFVDLNEAILEVEAQYIRFKEITGFEPRYFEAHAVNSRNLLKAIEIVAARHNLLFCDISFEGNPIIVNNQKMYLWLGSMKKDYDPFNYFQEMVKHAHLDGYDMMVFHPGYLDNFILSTSSLTINRTKEVDMLVSDVFKSYIVENDIHLYTYDEIK